MIYPALQIGTQWVMVDRTKIPAHGEMYYSPERGIMTELGGQIGKPEVYPKILAAFPKLEGVPLIPEEAVTNDLKGVLFNNAFKSEIVKDSPIETAIKRSITSKWFTIGFEAAGGYTREQMKRAFDCGRNYQLTGEDNFRELMDSFELNPTAFDCEENPDGSPKIENDTIVLKNVIYND